MFEPNTPIWDRYKLSPYNWRRLWEGLCVGTGGGRIKLLSNKGLRKPLHHFQQHAVVALI